MVVYLIFFIKLYKHTKFIKIIKCSSQFVNAEKPIKASVRNVIKAIVNIQ